MSKNKESSLNLSRRHNPGVFEWTASMPVHTQGQLRPPARGLQETRGPASDSDRARRWWKDFILGSRKPPGKPRAGEPLGFTEISAPQ